MKLSRFGAIPLAVATLLLAAGTSASASASAELGRSAFSLMVWGPDDRASAIELRCEPPGGSHPDPVASCTELANAGGDFGQLRTRPVACTMELRPVTATALGSWRGEPVRWQEEFSNPCTLRAATGPVFDF